MLTTSGKDYVASALGDSTSRAPVANILGLSANTAAVAASDTTIPGEITTAGGGLIAKVASYGHTTGASTYTLTATFTANGTDALPVTVAKVGVKNSAGAVPWQSLLTPTAPFSQSGDNTAITETITIS